MLNKIAQWVARPKVRYYADNFIWFWLALAAILSALAFFVNPTSAVATTPIAHVLHPYTFIWEAGFGAGGVGIIYGLVKRRPDWEALGQMFLAGAITIYWIAILALNPSAVGIFLYPALIISSLLRVAALVGMSEERANARREARPPDRDAKLYSLSALLILPLAALDPSLQALAVVLAALFGGGGYAAFKKIRPEVQSLGADMADKISTAADRIIARQASELERQAKELRELRGRISSLESAVLHQYETDRELHACVAARETALQAVVRLNHRVEELISFMGSAGLRVPQESPPKDPEPDVRR